MSRAWLVGCGWGGCTGYAESNQFPSNSHLRSPHLDVLEPILAVMEDEASAHFCFSRLMQRIGPKFDRESDRGIELCLTQLLRLIEYLDPELKEAIRQKDAEHMYFAYRWFLLDFKREFPAEAVFRVWEIGWAARHRSSLHFPVFVAYNIMHQYREQLMACSSFPEVLKLFNDLQMELDADRLIVASRTLIARLHASIGFSDDSSC